MFVVQPIALLAIEVRIFRLRHLHASSVGGIDDPGAESRRGSGAAGGIVGGGSCCRAFNDFV
jgi:hypothetical protein